MTTTDSPQLDARVARLARLDACALSDALDALGLPGCVTGLAHRAGAPRIAGRCITVKLVAAADAPPRDGPPRHLGSTAIEAGGPGSVIVVEQRTGIDAGSWGGILSCAAKVRRIEGVIADGPVRDIDEARTYEFPVFARGLTAFTARNRVAEAGTNVPITIGDVTVEADDFVLADSSAVVFVRAADIDRVLDKAEQLAAREAAMAQALLGGARVSDVMGATYEHMLVREA
jgi:regulator of RNase E activity RraA